MNAWLTHIHGRLPFVLLLRPETEAKAQEDEPELRGEPMAVGGTAPQAAEVKAAAPLHTSRARRRPHGICHAAARIVSIPVMTPFIYIAVHVV